jgi:hypothetical protein
MIGCVSTAHRAALCVALLAVGLGACSMTDSVIDPRFDHLNRTTAKARNEAILLNIVRASKNIPLNFATFSKINGSTSATGNAALPQFATGPLAVTSLQQTLTATGVITGQQQTSTLAAPGRNFVFSKDVFGGSLNANTNFDFSLLETKDFYAALLKPVDLANFNYFVRQGYSRELLFWLFVESVRETVGNRTVEFLNEPEQDKECQTFRGVTRCFRDMIDIAVASGLTVETRVEAPKDGGGKGSGRIYARLCFDGVLVQRVKRTYDPDIFKFVLISAAAGHRPRCKLDPWPHQVAADKAQKGDKDAQKAVTEDTTDTLTFTVGGASVGTIKYEIITRSTFGIYQFLGRILAENQQDEFEIRGTSEGREDRRILGLRRDAGGDGCFADTVLEGEFYCVPREGAENTKRIFSLLAQLVALNTQIGDLAITPTVRLAQ